MTKQRLPLVDLPDPIPRHGGRAGLAGSPHRAWLVAAHARFPCRACHLVIPVDAPFLRSRQAGAPGQALTPGAAAQQPVAVPPPDAYHAQPHIPQTFQPTGRKKALICACNYACGP